MMYLQLLAKRMTGPRYHVKELGSWESLQGDLNGNKIGEFIVARLEGGRLCILDKKS